MNSYPLVVSYGVCLFATLFETGVGPFIMRVPVDCSWNATYESLLGSTKIFAQPIPLGVRSLGNLHVFLLFRIYLAQTDVFTCLFGFPMAGNGRFPRGWLGAGGPV
jgi:hypothetical protein